MENEKTKIEDVMELEENKKAVEKIKSLLN